MRKINKIIEFNRKIDMETSNNTDEFKKFIKSEMIKFDKNIFIDYFLQETSDKYYVNDIFLENGVLMEGDLFAELINVNTGEKVYLYSVNMVVIEYIFIEIGKVIESNNCILRGYCGLTSLVLNENNFLKEEIYQEIYNLYQHMSLDDLLSLTNISSFYKKLIINCLNNEHVNVAGIYSSVFKDK